MDTKTILRLLIETKIIERQGLETGSKYCGLSAVSSGLFRRGNKMASSLVRSAVTSVVTDEKYFESKRMKEIRQLADSISSQIMMDEKMEIFDEFAKSLYGILEEVVISWYLLVTDSCCGENITKLEIVAY